MAKEEKKSVKDKVLDKIGDVVLGKDSDADVKKIENHAQGHGSSSGDDSKR